LGDGKLVKNLGFLERTDLITWLEGATDESDFIKAPTQSETTAAQKKDVNGKGAIGASSQQSLQGAGSRPRRALDPRLAEIYGRERVVANRNSILRGIKPTVSTFCPFLLFPPLSCSSASTQVLPFITDKAPKN